MAREAISSAAPQGLALTLGVGAMVVVVDVLMVRVGICVFLVFWYLCGIDVCFQFQSLCWQASHAYY